MSNSWERDSMSFLRTPSIARLSNRALLSVSGSQASEFLNGILAAAITKRPTYSALLHAQARTLGYSYIGRVLYDVFLYTNTDDVTSQQGYLVEYDSRPSDAPSLLPMLKKYVLRSKVRIRDVTEQYDVWASWGSPLDCPRDTFAREWRWAPSGAVEPVWNTADTESPWGSDDYSLLDRRAVGLGTRFLVKRGDRPQRATTHDIRTSDDYALHRISLGVPEGQVDIPPMQAFPIESNMDIMGGLDFRKGCYVGQELTVRTYHTGAVRKRILPVTIHLPQNKYVYCVLLLHHPYVLYRLPETISPNPNAPLYPTGLDIRPVIVQKDKEQSTPRPRGTGKLLTSLQGVGLALLRLEHVEAVMKGTMQLQLHEGERTWSVSPWQPSWWPNRAVGIEN
ncbi:Aminomethyltransferase folate-binding domain containing protein [Amanita muscaria]